MAYRSGLVDSLFILRWVGTPTRADVSAVVRDAKRARETFGRPACLFIISPRDSDAPSAEARAEMTHSWQEMEKNFAAGAIVLEGSGLRLTAKRAAVAGLMIVMRTKFPMSVHATVPEALVKLRASLAKSPDEVLREAGKLGLLSEPEVAAQT